MQGPNKKELTFEVRSVGLDKFNKELTDGGKSCKALKDSIDEIPNQAKKGIPVLSGLNGLLQDGTNFLKKLPLHIKENVNELGKVANNISNLQSILNPALEKNTKILQVHTKAVKEQNSILGDSKFLDLAGKVTGKTSFFGALGFANDISADAKKMASNQDEFTSSVNESSFAVKELFNIYEKFNHKFNFLKDDLVDINQHVADIEEATKNLNKERVAQIQNARNEVDRLRKEYKDEDDKFRDEFPFSTFDSGRLDDTRKKDNNLKNVEKELNAVISSINAYYDLFEDKLKKNYEKSLKTYAENQVANDRLSRILSKKGMDRELEAMNQQYEALALHAKENGLDITAITEYYLKEQERIKNKYAQKTIKGTKNKNRALIDEEKEHNEEINNLVKGLLQANFEQIFNQNGKDEQLLQDGLNTLRDNSKGKLDAEAFFQEKSLVQTESFNQRKDKLIKGAQQSMANFAKATKESNNAVEESTEQTATSFEDKWTKINETMQKHVDTIMTGVNAIFSGINSILSSELEEANEKLDTITTQYDEVVQKREESSEKIQALEEEAKNASGGRALVLQEQIMREMEANQQLANQEKELAKEKEKQEKEVAKKEKQKKRSELAQNIVQGVANTALGATKAWSLGPIVGPILAGIVAAAGAIQVGVMTKQLAKLEDGGLLNGKRHSQGGMRIEGSNIEVEGGEYVVNRESTSKNLGLVRYINSERRELKPSDLDAYFNSLPRGEVGGASFSRMFADGGQLPVVEPNSSIDNEALVYAIKNIRIEPRVAVTDIHKAQDSMVSVDSWTGV